MIRFTKIYIEGFGSILGPLWFEFDSTGLTVIRGKNGKGKTTLFSALSWALYGKSLKDKSQVETWEHLRNKNWKGTKVEIHYQDGQEEFIVRRHLKYKGKSSKLEFEYNGIVDDSLRDKRDIQAAITRSIRMSYELFKTTLVFGQKMKRITEESNVDQKKIFDEAFESGFINEARDRTKKELEELQEEYTAVEIEANKLTWKLEAKQEALDEEKWRRVEHETERQEAIDNYTESIKQGKAKLKKLKAEIPKRASLEDQKALVTKLDDSMRWDKFKKELEIKCDTIQDLDSDIEDYERELETLVLTKEEGLTCDSCGQPIEDKALDAKIKKDKARAKEIKERLAYCRKELKQYQAELVDMNEELVVVNKEIAKWEKAQEILDDLIDQQEQITKDKANIAYTESKLASDGKSLADLEKKAFKSKETEIEDEISRLEERLAPLKKTLGKLSRRMETKQWLIKDPLSNDGLKAFIFNQMLAKVNNELSTFSTTLGFRPEFAMNISGTRKNLYCIIYKGKNPVLYDDLSGGQKQLVNIATAFAFIMARDSENPTSMLIMDEAFESLDEDNVELVNSLIEQIAIKKAVYLITHQANFNPTNSNNITISMVNGQTIID